MQKFLTAVLSIVTTVLCFPQTRVHAAHSTPLFHASREYRDATHYLANMLTYHAVLDPTQKRFVKRLISSSHQLYSAALGSTADLQFQRTWVDIQKLMHDLPWVLESLPCDVKQKMAPTCRQFLNAFQTLAIQIELCERPSRNSELGNRQFDNSSSPVPETPRRVIMLRVTPSPHSHLPPGSPYCPCVRCHVMTRPIAHDAIHVVASPPSALSPSEWQLRQSEPQCRSEMPIRRKNGKRGARLSRLVQPQ
ncbi:hypothetical protein OAF83_00985 [Rubripirellula sp.]|jgi:hypothetical protein|nr:hypothetical protein [Rubripirellula sp.]MDB4749455.1 hypothetical protein [Rubripirellula sp.]